MAGTRWTRCAPGRSGRWRRTASTGCSSPPPRTNGYLESFTALLELLDDQRFARGVRPAETQLARVMVRRLKRDLPPRWDGTPRFPQRNLDYLEASYSEPERHAHELLNRYAASRCAAGDKPAKAAAEFVTTLLKRRNVLLPAGIRPHPRGAPHDDDQPGAAPRHAGWRAGAEGTRLHEEVMTADGLIEQGRLAQATTDEITSS